MMELDVNTPKTQKCILEESLNELIDLLKLYKKIDMEHVFVVELIHFTSRIAYDYGMTKERYLELQTSCFDNVLMNKKILK